MINITHKTNSLRKARARAILKVGAQSTIDAILHKKVSKGDVFEMSKTAGLFAVKNTSSSIPDCHPLPIEYTSIVHRIEGLEIIVEVEVHTIYKTGVEVEAMFGASVVALTMYDMLKPLDKEIEVSGIKLMEKSGGKSDFATATNKEIRLAVIVCSDSVSLGKKADTSGKAILEKLGKYPLINNGYFVVPDEPDIIREKVLQLTSLNDLLILTGGTGLSKRDNTPDCLRPLLHKEIPGIAEAIRSYGQQRTPYSMLSRSLAGLIDKTLVLALPGSEKGAIESLEAVFPAILHIFNVLEGEGHNEDRRK